MKLIRTQDAVGHVLCHDMTQIIKDKYKDARFRKGHVVTEADIPVLLSMGKKHLYVWETTPGMVHENDAAERLLALCGQENMTRSEVKEGKIELKAACDGVFLVDSQRLIAVNGQDEVMIATRKGGTAVRKGDKLAGMRVIPLIIEEEKLQKAERAAGTEPLLTLRPYVRKTACIVATGGEVKSGLIKDTFTPVVVDKLKAYGIETLEVVYSGDGVENVRDAVLAMREKQPDMILCTGGMSVDPDDNTPGGIKAAGANIVAYGAPVLPGAMFLLGYFDDGMPVMGLPGCVMYAGATVFDLLLALVMALSLMACGNNNAAANDDQTPAETVELTVFAAASLTESLTAIGEKYMAENENVKINFNFDSSGKLYTQIKEGAPCDLFISAAPKQMNQLDGTLKDDADKNPDGLDMLVEGSRLDLLENKVVLAVAEGSDKGIDSFDKLAELLKAGSVTLTIGNEDVPVGQYTKKIFTYYEIDEAAIAANLTYGSNVKEVTTAVSEGTVDCGIIYASDAYSAGLTVAAEATADMCGQVIYPAAVLNTSAQQEAAAAFLAYLQTAEASAEFEKVLFTPLSK